MLTLQPHAPEIWPLPLKSHVHYLSSKCYCESNIMKARCATSVWLPPAPPREQFVQQAVMHLFLFHFFSHTFATYVSFSA